MIDIELRTKSAEGSAAQYAPLPSNSVTTSDGEPGLTRRQITILATVIASYAALSFYSDSTPEKQNLAAVLSIGPVVLIGLALAWRWTHPLVWILIAGLTCGALYRFWPTIRGNYQWSNLVQQAGAYALIAWGFARSLSAGLVPLCTQLAERLHGPLTTLEVAYMRRATVAWAIFYVALTAAIVALFFALTQRLWSFFVNFATFGLIATMFFAEHAVRRRMLQRRPHGSTLSALRQFLIG